MGEGLPGVDCCFPVLNKFSAVNISKNGSFLTEDFTSDVSKIVFFIMLGMNPFVRKLIRTLSSK